MHIPEPIPSPVKGIGRSLGGPSVIHGILMHILDAWIMSCRGRRHVSAPIGGRAREACVGKDQLSYIIDEGDLAGGVHHRVGAATEKGANHQRR